MMSVYQPGSGFVLSELAIEARLNIALAAGAELHGHETVLNWEQHGGKYRVTTNRGTYEATSLVVASGAWAGRMLAPFAIPVKPERQVVGWFQPKESPELFRPARMPSWIIDSATLGHFYGLPIHGIPGFKLSKFFFGDIVEPGRPLIEAQPQEEEVLRVFLRRYFPKADGPVMSLGATFFENTPRSRFRRRPLARPPKPLACRWPQRTRFQILQRPRRGGGRSGHDRKIPLRIVAFPGRSLQPAIASRGPHADRGPVAGIFRLPALSQHFGGSGLCAADDGLRPNETFPLRHLEQGIALHRVLVNEIAAAAWTEAQATSNRRTSNFVLEPPTPKPYEQDLGHHRRWRRHHGRQHRLSSEEARPARAAPGPCRRGKRRNGPQRRGYSPALLHAPVGPPRPREH
ncbi:MAG: FAD-dependent oxidoreductase [Opitutus sp.]|nr:FAD-dependent oxidoreductase [Opitutus sp.]